MVDELSSKLGTAKEQIRVTYYTDPYDVWGLAVEPVLDKLMEEFPGRLRVVYRAFPIVRDVDEVLPADKTERIRFFQGLASLFREVSKRTGIKMDPSFLYDDPPKSTWPACTAFKAAMRQGTRRGDRFLRRLRRAGLQENRNITRGEVLKELAQDSGLDIDRFMRDFYSKETEREVEEDFEKGIREGVEGIPALVFGNDRGLQVTVLGVRSFEEYRKVVGWLSGGEGEAPYHSFYA